MSAWKELRTLADLDALDDDLVVAGYRAGLRNQPDYTQTSQDYWHGFMNGQVDGHHIPMSEYPTNFEPGVREALFRRVFGAAHQ